MITISNALEQIIAQTPFLEEYLSMDIINTSSLARYVKPQIEERIGKKVKDSAVMMALRRLPIPNTQLHKNKTEQMLQQITDVSIRSSLLGFTYKNTISLKTCLAKYLKNIENDPDVFFTLSQGIHESTIIVNSSWETEIKKLFRNELLVGSENQLTAINIKLPKLNTKTKGIYYMIFKYFTEADINVKDVVSTSNELTILIDNEDSEAAFSTINKIRAK